MDSEVEEAEEVTVRVQMPLDLYYEFDAVVREGLNRIRDTLAGLKKLEDSMPSFPKPRDIVEEPRLGDVPLSREAIHRMVLYYRDLESHAIALLQIREDERARNRVDF